MPTRHLVDPTYARELAARIEDGKVQKPESYGDKTLVAPADPPHELVA